MGERGPSESTKSKHFGPYTVLERIGVGGMATVHLATEESKNGSQRVVALKRLLPHLANDEEFVRSFVREAQLSSLLHHDNIAEVYELGRVGECYFIAMEYIHGRDLRSCLKRAQRVVGPPPIEFTMFLLMELCDALAYAHSRVDINGDLLGLVHRDISPANLIIAADGHIKIIDFGIAKATASHDVTRSGAIKGKLAYLPPETLAGKLDARADLFSVGVVAYELLTAKPLFADKNDFKVLNNIQHLNPPPPSTVNPACPKEIDDIILKALAKSPKERWQSAKAMLKALQHTVNQYGMRPSTQHVSGWVDATFALVEPTGPQDVLEADKPRPNTGDLLAGSTASRPTTREHESLLPRTDVTNNKLILTPLDDEPPTEVEFSLSDFEDEETDDNEEMELETLRTTKAVVRDFGTAPPAPAKQPLTTSEAITEDKIPHPLHDEKTTKTSVPPRSPPPPSPHLGASAPTKPEPPSLQQLMSNIDPAASDAAMEPLVTFKTPTPVLGPTTATASSPVAEGTDKTTRAPPTRSLEWVTRGRLFLAGGTLVLIAAIAYVLTT